MTKQASRPPNSQLRNQIIRLASQTPHVLQSNKDPKDSLKVRLVSIDASLRDAYWEVEVAYQEGKYHVISGNHGESQMLNKHWPGSWIALSTPIVLHLGTSGYRPEFVVRVPSNVHSV